MFAILYHTEQYKILISCICVYTLTMLNIIYTHENTTDSLIENLMTLENRITYKFLLEPMSNNSKKYVQTVIRDLCEYNKYLLRLLNYLQLNKSQMFVDYIYSLEKTFGPSFLDLSLKEIPLAEKLLFRDKNVRKAITYNLNATQYLWDECKRTVLVTEPPIRNIIVTNGEPFRWIITTKLC